MLVKNLESNKPSTHHLYLFSMFSKAESAKLRQEFWTTLGRLIKRQLSADGIKINWINYKTGVKDIYFRMHTTPKKASISIEITHSNEGLRALFFEQFEALKTYLHNILGEEWIWDDFYTNDYGVQCSRIYIELEGKNYFIKDDWTDIFAFFKTRLIKLDQFWCDANETFVELAQ
jgi:hypothetical protein